MDIRRSEKKERPKRERLKGEAKGSCGMEVAVIWTFDDKRVLCLRKCGLSLEAGLFGAEPGRVHVGPVVGLPAGAVEPAVLARARFQSRAAEVKHEAVEDAPWLHLFAGEPRGRSHEDGAISFGVKGRHSACYVCTQLNECLTTKRAEHLSLRFIVAVVVVVVVALPRCARSGTFPGCSSSIACRSKAAATRRPAGAARPSSASAQRRRP